ncbi:unnamed protein product [Blepharisma stoltei]|uniref:Uncharacterized protein n=1 Tax=Blepharisma stoltei TaxID=1481888 RepID=A0AAU9IUW5_9CILI|nr:unnamed protein product [Blepharisma stoltei]
MTIFSVIFYSNNPLMSNTRCRSCPKFYFLFLFNGCSLLTYSCFRVPSLIQWDVLHQLLFLFLEMHIYLRHNGCRRVNTYFSCSIAFSLC